MEKCKDRQENKISVIAMNMNWICRFLLHLISDIAFFKVQKNEFLLAFIQNNNRRSLAWC